MNNLAFVICTKESTHIYNCVEKINQAYSGSADVIIVDSCSTDKKYFELKEKYSNVFIEDICNKNYEYGAILHGLKTYNNYEKYVFLQDSLMINEKIKEIDHINDDEVYVFGDGAVETGWILDPEAKTIFHGKSPEFPVFTFVGEKFVIAEWNCFTANKNTLMKIIESDLFSKAAPADEKMMSRAWERIWTIIFMKIGMKVKMLEQTQYTKIFGKRQ